AKFAEYEKKYAEEAAELKSIADGVLPAGWEKALPTYTPETPGDATRNLSQTMLNALAPVLPGLVGGSADLASSNMTLMKMFGDFQKATPEERNIRFGVREHGMGATMLNALAPVLPGLVGGSADLASSNMTLMKMFGDFQKATPEERNIRFGVREHGMGAICNGIALYSPGFE
ncbi:hypothetical protein FKB34_17035, partial [Glycocaulis profundi]